MKVSLKIAKMLEQVKPFSAGNNYAYGVHRFLDKAVEISNKEEKNLQKWLSENNITVKGIEYAITNGWEIDTPFKKGDLVKFTANLDGKDYFRVVRQCEGEEFQSVRFTNGNCMPIERIELVCKSGFFEDGGTF